MPHDLMTRGEQKKEFRDASGDYSKWVQVSASEVAGVWIAAGFGAPSRRCQSGRSAASAVDAADRLAFCVH